MSHSTDIAVTGRLRRRPLHADDLPAVVAYRAQPDVARHQSWQCSYG